MPGQCYGCRTEFSFFKKEHGCKNCGFAFCSKCLAEKSIAVPRKNNAKHHVCFKCFKILSGPAEPAKAQAYDVPEAYLKRMAALKEKESSQPQSSAHGMQKPQSKFQNLDKADRDIAMRLEQLREKEKPKAQVTDKEISVRLAHIKGQNYMPETKSMNKPPERRLAPQQVDDLLEEIASEVEIDSHRPDAAADVEARLARLRGHEGNSNRESHHNLENNLNKPSGLNKPGYSKNIGSVTGKEEEENTDLDAIHRLMAEVAAETEGDARRALEGMHRDEELMARLREGAGREDKSADSSNSNTDNTKQGAVAAISTTSSDDESDDEGDDAEAKRIIQRYLEEASIDDKIESTSRENNPSKEIADGGGECGECREPPPSNVTAPSKELVEEWYDESELPYCSICTEDAALRCRGCDRDLFCQRCFREYHQSTGETDHRTSPFTMPKGYS